MSEDAADGARPRWLAKLLKIDSNDKVDRVLVTTLAVVTTLGASGGLVNLADLEPDTGPYEAAAVASMLTVATIGTLFWKFTAPRESAEQVSRRRVRDAERNFEEALRAGQATVDPETPAGPFGPLDRREAGADASPPATVDPSPRAGGLALPELWTLTHTRLDAYHEIALAQARRSFRNAQVAMGLGFALLLAFVFVALNASTTAGAVVAGGLGAVSAALAGYVSRTFVVSQTASAAHLRAYFDQPLEFARYLAAERIIMDCGLDQAQRTEVLTSLVQAMVAPPAAPDPAGQVGARGIPQ
ncbi:TRADD-N-associated membrane domain-containing protein [Streptomyces pactum]|uniref:Cyanobacterial TRADD-N associated 2 transmembrane domain-containing protein n=1 Tax=Streptomyces pactum TaxID=68249 RepID=A0A1S6J2H4_9ACTN|nr:hypothetical protein [Streptomyces pactum]AQS65953.1 hypothetical protein B1H29_02480 [Streptomyces pactum]